MLLASVNSTQQKVILETFFPASCRDSTEETKPNTQRVRSRSEDRRARPGGGSRSSGAPTATAGSLSSDRSTTLRRPQNAAQRHVSPSPARSSALRAVSRILVTTSGELILLPVGSRHPKLNLGWCPVTSYSDSDIVFAHFPGISHFPSPKWRLKLLPVPVLTRNFDFSHTVSY